MAETRMLPLASIRANKGQIPGVKGNPRCIRNDKYEKLKKSLEDNPEMLDLRELLVYEHEGKYVCIGGNMRYRACRELGLKEVPCKVIPAEATPEQLNAYIIKDNSGFGEWDWDMLANEWDTDLLEDWGVDFTFDAGEAIEETGEAKEDDFDEEKEEIPSRCSKGDIWQCGVHRLMCGDSTSAGDVGRLMRGERADMVFTDPPYGMKKEAEGVLNDNLNSEDLVEFNKQWIRISFDTLKENGSWYCWGIDESLLDIYAVILRPMVNARKITFRNLITWDKGTGMGQLSPDCKKYPVADEKCLFAVCGAATMSSGKFATKEYFFEGFEPIRDYLCAELKKSGLTIKGAIELTSSYASHYFSRSQWAFPTEKDYKILQKHCNNAAFQKEYAAFQKEYADLQKEYADLQKEYADLLPYFNNTHTNMNSIWHFERTSKNERETTGGHATPKPVELCCRGIKSSSREGEKVLDLFGGSGTTMIACEQLGRKCYMMELDPHYCDVIIARWEKLTGEQAVKLS